MTTRAARRETAKAVLAKLAAVGALTPASMDASAPASPPPPPRPSRLHGFRTTF